MGRASEIVFIFYLTVFRIPIERVINVKISRVFLIQHYRSIITHAWLDA